MNDTQSPPITTSGEGPALVLLPGMDGTGRLFYRQIPLLSRRFRVVTYALRETAHDMDTLIADLAAVVDAVAPEPPRAIIVGESFGGTLALSFALAHPDKVQAVVTLNSFPYFAPQVRLWLAWRLLRILPVGTMPLVRRLAAFRLHSGHTHRDEVERFMTLTRDINREGYLNRLRILRGYDVRSRLHEIVAPSLFLAADADHLVPAVAQAKLMTAHVPNSMVRVLEGHGHICLIAPDLDLETILREWGPPAH